MDKSIPRVMSKGKAGGLSGHSPVGAKAESLSSRSLLTSLRVLSSSCSSSSTLRNWSCCCDINSWPCLLLNSWAQTDWRRPGGFLRRPQGLSSSVLMLLMLRSADSRGVLSVLMFNSMPSSDEIDFSFLFEAGFQRLGTNGIPGWRGAVKCFYI